MYHAHERWQSSGRLASLASQSPTQSDVQNASPRQSPSRPASLVNRATSHWTPTKGINRSPSPAKLHISSPNHSSVKTISSPISSPRSKAFDSPRRRAVTSPEHSNRLHHSSRKVTTSSSPIHTSHPQSPSRSTVASRSSPNRPPLSPTSPSRTSPTRGHTASTAEKKTTPQRIRHSSRRESSPLMARPGDFSMLGEVSFEATSSVGDKTYDALEVAVETNRERRKSMGLGLLRTSHQPRSPGTQAWPNSPSTPSSTPPASRAPPHRCFQPSPPSAPLTALSEESDSRDSMSPYMRADSAAMVRRPTPTPSESTLTSDVLLDSDSFRFTPPPQTPARLYQPNGTPSRSRESTPPAQRTNHMRGMNAGDQTMDIAQLLTTTKTAKPKRPSGTEESFLVATQKLELAELSFEKSMLLPESLRPKYSPPPPLPPLPSRTPSRRFESRVAPSTVAAPQRTFTTDHSASSSGSSNAGLMSRTGSTRRLGRSNSVRSIVKDGVALPNSDSMPHPNHDDKEPLTATLPKSDSMRHLRQEPSVVSIPKSNTMRRLNHDDTIAVLPKSDTMLHLNSQTQEEAATPKGDKFAPVPAAVAPSSSIHSLTAALARGEATLARRTSVVATPRRRIGEHGDVPVTMRRIGTHSRSGSTLSLAARPSSPGAWVNAVERDSVVSAPPVEAPNPASTVNGQSAPAPIDNNGAHLSLANGRSEGPTLTRTSSMRKIEGGASSRTSMRKVESGAIANGGVARSGSMRAIAEGTTTVARSSSMRAVGSEVAGSTRPGATRPSTVSHSSRPASSGTGQAGIQRSGSMRRVANTLPAREPEVSETGSRSRSGSMGTTVVGTGVRQTLALPVDRERGRSGSSEASLSSRASRTVVAEPREPRPRMAAAPIGARPTEARPRPSTAVTEVRSRVGPAVTSTRSRPPVAAAPSSTRPPAASAPPSRAATTIGISRPSLAGRPSAVGAAGVTRSSATVTRPPAVGVTRPSVSERPATTSMVRSTSRKTLANGTSRTGAVSSTRASLLPPTSGAVRPPSSSRSAPPVPLGDGVSTVNRAARPSLFGMRTKLSAPPTSTGHERDAPGVSKRMSATQERASTAAAAVPSRTGLVKALTRTGSSRPGATVTSSRTAVPSSRVAGTSASAGAAAAGVAGSSRRLARP